MCLSIPVKILEIKKNKAIVDFIGKKEEVDVQLMPNVKIGDYALISNGFIIKKISAQEAEEIFNVIKPKEGKEEK
ncbi:MAG: HypC/HybG/HupF family hydrogenase formation chaperone [Candidatus Portnoybacteria bacterium CG10_big_fil_rev_8_21_14_0_10_38_18]|uniref:HypC/HybG/HupF family hydrogenase formation chaperone n=1 Tax=Candidatus Portnoybacteria bacterium CG10_big_fil_rev_8_21_14_0_10_38_18 TaxID=1974813 RepID=A0A2M8KCT0_9BACT|nr:MAG: HypC/HybG/HupF family hydrogenase formation chaperone [Candidatus Portnoybacteria bacterium CG10_big_fil_rev_8_21_14_0_10_38_18]